MNFKSSVALAIVLAFCSKPSQAQKIGDLYPNSQESIQSGVSLYEEQKYTEAIEKFKLVEDGDSLYSSAQFELALTYAADSQFTSSLQITDDLIKRYPIGHLQTKIMKGQILDFLNQSDASVAWYSEMAQEAPNINKIFSERAGTLMRSEKYELALKDLMESLRLNPYHGNTHAKIGVLAIEAEQPALAIMALFFSTIVQNDQSNVLSKLSIIESISQNSYEKIYEKITPDLFAFASDLQEINEVVLSKAALNKKYKTKLKADYMFARQLQVICEMLSPSYSSDNSLLQFYTSFYKQMWDKGQFVGMATQPLSSINDSKTQSLVKKNKKKIDAFVIEASNFLNTKAQGLSYTYNGAQKTGNFKYKNSNLLGIVDSENAQGFQGNSIYFHPTGEISATGKFLDNQKDGEWNYYNLSGVLISTENFRKGMKHGKSIEFNDYGIKKSEIEYVDGKESGKTVYYHNNGARQTELAISNGVVNGIAQKFDDADRLEQKMELENNKLKNKFETYNKNGSLQSEIAISNNSFDGKFLSKNEKGIIKTEGNFSNGERTGEWKFYSDEGNLIQKGNYDNGQFTGVWESYDDNGKLTESENYKNNKLNGESIAYDRNQKMLSKINYRNGKGIDYTYYDENGKVLYNAKLNTDNTPIVLYNSMRTKYSEGLIKNESEHGLWKFYHNNGALKKEVNYKEGLMDGICKEYFETGELALESYYVNGLMSGYFKSYDKFGNKLIDGYKLEGEFHGPWHSYYTNGQIKEREFFWHGSTYGNVIQYTPDSKIVDIFFENDGIIATYTAFDTLGKDFNHQNLDKGNGTLKYVHANGAKMLEANYLFGKRNGQSIRFDPQGKTIEEQTIIFGEQNGQIKSHYADGSQRTQGQYENGLQAGEWLYYNEQGTLHSKSHYKNGNAEGPTIHYHQNGKVFQERNYYKDLKDGKFHYYDEDGTLIIIMNYKEGVLLSYSYNDASGKPVADIPLVNETGKVLAKYPNGKTSMQFEMINGQYEGDLIIYYANGQIKIKNKSFHGEYIGTNYTYSSKGQVLSQEEFKQGEQDGVSKYFSENGKPISEITYKCGVMHGPAKFYDKNGKLKNQGNCYYDAYIQK